MEESDRPEEKRHVTKAVTSEPQEEFIEPKARPSRDEADVETEAPPNE
jgi:hypothetical protein